MLKTILLTATALVLLPGVALADDAPGDSWAPSGFEGFYAGINGGYAKGTMRDSTTPADYPDVAIGGSFVGGQAGYNFALINGVVAGIQGDLDWANETGSSGPTGSTIGLVHHATLDDSIKWTGALTGRVGTTMGGAMLYGLAGVAAAGNSLSNTGDDGLGGASPVEAEASGTHVGWTVGGGIGMLAGAGEAFLEYRFADYGKADYSASVGSHPVDLVDQSVRVGFNYHMH
jgi:outer membrane immunogenic protein